MVVIVFLVDTSASMNQKTSQGTSYLDVAKNGILTFMKYRLRDLASIDRYEDRYMLVTLDDPPSSSIKVGLLNQSKFTNELKNLHAKGISTLSRGLKDALDLLNTQRLQTGIDQYGQGRFPFYLEPAVIIAITDGENYMKTGTSGNIEIEDEVLFPLCGSYSGSELTKEMFRWDQRLFTVLLKIPGIVSNTDPAATNGVGGGARNGYDPVNDHFSSLCEYSGGKCYSVSSIKTLYQVMESLSQKMFSGVVLNFRKISSSEASENSFHDWKRRERQSKSKENTPIPAISNSITQHPQQPSMLTNDTDSGGTREVSPPDKSTPSWSNLRKMIYVRSKFGEVASPGHWPIPESFWPELPNGSLPPRDVHPVVWFDDKDVPPVLLESFAFDKYEMEQSPLTQQLLAKKNPNICWEVFIIDSGKEKGLTHPFGYLKASSSGNFVNLFVMPFNYQKLIPLIEELQRQRLKPSSKWRSDFNEYILTLPSYYAQPLRNSLKLMGANPGLVPESFDGSMSYSVTNYLRKLKKQSEMDTNELFRQANSTKKSSKVNEVNGISVAIGTTEIESLSSQSYRNPFDITRLSLLEQVSRMRSNFLHSSRNTPHLIEEVDKHQVPIGQMGKYQQHLKHTLRELDTGAVRTQLFGNPFKLEKPSDKNNMADEIMVEQHIKRPGSPNREHHRFKRRHSRSPTPHSPTPSPSNQTPPTSPNPAMPDQKKPIQKDSSTLSSPSLKEDKQQNFLNRKNMAPVETANHPKPVPRGSAQDTSSSPSSSKGGGIPPPPPPPGIMEPPEQPAVVSDRPPMKNESVPNTLTNSSSIKDHHNPHHHHHHHHHHSVAEKIKDKNSSAINRKRSPSPSSIAPPYPKRPNNKDLLRTESVGRLHNEKSPSPSPLLTPIRQAGLSSASQVLNEEFKRKQTTQNLKLKQTICKEIRKNNKSYDAIFQSLENVQGGVEAKKSFVKEIIREAEKFRKKQLVQHLEDWIGKLGPGSKTPTTEGATTGRMSGSKNSTRHTTNSSNR